MNFISWSPFCELFLKFEIGVLLTDIEIINQPTWFWINKSHKSSQTGKLIDSGSGLRPGSPVLINKQKASPAGCEDPTRANEVAIQSKDLFLFGATCSFTFCFSTLRSFLFILQSSKYGDVFGHLLIIYCNMFGSSAEAKLSGVYSQASSSQRSASRYNLWNFFSFLKAIEYVFLFLFDNFFLCND